MSKITVLCPRYNSASSPLILTSNDIGKFIEGVAVEGTSSRESTKFVIIIPAEFTDIKFGDEDSITKVPADKTLSPEKLAIPFVLIIDTVPNIDPVGDKAKDIVYGPFILSNIVPELSYTSTIIVNSSVLNKG